MKALVQFRKDAWPQEYQLWKSKGWLQAAAGGQSPVSRLARTKVGAPLQGNATARRACS